MKETVNIHETRAPTDDSIRLAKEYEEKCWQKVRSAVLKEIEPINAEFLVIEHDFRNDTNILLFKINNKEVQISLRSGEDEIYAIAQEITKTLIEKLFYRGSICKSPKRTNG